MHNRFFISSKVPLIQPHHIELDKVFGKVVGTTGNGIGPAYAEQALKVEGSKIKCVRIGDYLNNPELGKAAVKANLLEVNQKYNLEIDVEKVVDNFDAAVRKVLLYVSQDPLFLQKKLEEGKNLFMEGAQSCMLDLIYGTYPFVTSSRTVAAAAYTGGDVSLKYHAETIGVANAIMSRVGNGPFVTEFGRERLEIYCG